MVGVLQVDVFKGLLGLDYAESTCPYCGKVNVFSDFSEVTAFVCDGCGKTVENTGGG